METDTTERSLAAMPGSDRLEALRLKLCSIGLHPLHHETPEKAAEAVCEMISYFRRENLDPPHHLQSAVLRKLRVFGHMEEGDPAPLYQLVPYPNNKAKIGAGPKTKCLAYLKTKGILP